MRVQPWPFHAESTGSSFGSSQRRGLHEGSVSGRPPRTIGTQRCERDSPALGVAALPSRAAATFHWTAGALDFELLLDAQWGLADLRAAPLAHARCDARSRARQYGSLDRETLTGHTIRPSKAETKPVRSVRSRMKSSALRRPGVRGRVKAAASTTPVRSARVPDRDTLTATVMSTLSYVPFAQSARQSSRRSYQDDTTGAAWARARRSPERMTNWRVRDRAVHRHLRRKLRLGRLMRCRDIIEEMRG